MEHLNSCLIHTNKIHLFWNRMNYNDSTENISFLYRVFFAIAFTAMVIGQSSSFLPEYSKAKHAAGLIFKAFDTVPSIDIYSKRGTYLVCNYC